MMELNEQKQSAFMMAEQLMGYFSVFIAFVLGFLIVYANNYLIKRRKRVWNLYDSWNGKWKLIKNDILRNSIYRGYISRNRSGTRNNVISSTFSTYSLYVPGRPYKVSICFSPLGFKRTVLCFSIIYLVVLIFNFISVRKIKLIDLLTASKRNENPTIKNLWVSVILFLVSVGILVTAYYKVIHDGIAFASFNALGLPILLGCIGTFIFFYSLTGFFLKVIQGNKNSI